MALRSKEQDTRNLKKTWVAPEMQTRGAGPVAPLLMCTPPEVSCEAFGRPNLCVQNICQCDDSC